MTAPQDYLPCICPQPGFCPRYQREMAGRLHLICQGKVLGPYRTACYRQLWAERAGQTPPPLVKPTNDPPPPGAGTELKKLLAWFNQLSDEECLCNARAAVMDREGIDWCESNQSVIIGWLMEEWDKRGMKLSDFLPSLVVKAMKSLHFTDERGIAERGAGWAVRRAIHNARRA